MHIQPETCKASHHGQLQLTPVCWVNLPITRRARRQFCIKFKLSRSTNDTLETFRILAFPFILARGVSRNRIVPHSLIDRQVFVAGARPLALLPLLSPTIFSRFVWLELVTDKKSIIRTLGLTLFLYRLEIQLSGPAASSGNISQCQGQSPPLSR
ncbi:hypothetical protein HCBG_05210 [Histoplasma capsulatum G186AR]|uniref:Uncharacterized protein n=1 Tax=Ajellomyces capsulatus (strain G186AR / H82 / ATCC MYA-2454 / RMSCC 2432) TaxID=447093 RepID=C0NPY0_AJECG|nr:uncharacterized protein HCBG_05210 [Histoplasma capsulatum G186AR]EEH06990.1 hypothetical protein HCBG_05210 [Histoplasma capsulatum G186AR]